MSDSWTCGEREPIRFSTASHEAVVLRRARSTVLSLSARPKAADKSSDELFPPEIYRVCCDLVCEMG
jgi:hypothetical protein